MRGLRPPRLRIGNVPMPGPRAHHYVPVFYLKGFIDPWIFRRQKRIVLWVYERGREVRRSTPANEAHQKDFYVHEMGSIETGLGKIEGHVAPIFDDVLEKRRFLTNQEKSEMAHFISLMFMRGPSGRGFVDELGARLMKHETLKLAKDEVEFRKLYEEASRDEGIPVSADTLREWVLKGEFEVVQKSPGYNLRMALECSTDIGNVMEELDWQLLYTATDDLFITSDSPVVSLESDGRGKAIIGAGFGRPGVEVFSPMSSTICVRMKRGIREGIHEIPGGWVRNINKVFMSCSRRFVYAGMPSATLKRLFDRVGCRVIYGVNALLPPPLTD